MPAETSTPNTVSSTVEPVTRGRIRRRGVAMAVWAAAFGAGWLLLGLPIDPLYAFGWVWAATIAWHIERPWRYHLAFARDWSPVLLLLIGYNLSRGFADNGAVPHVYELVGADTRMWGWLTSGTTPTLWLQHHLYDAAHIHWWDVLASFVYFSHFIATSALAVVLWLRNRARWAWFVRRWVFLSLAGLVTYFLYPAAPPWWAAKYGLTDPVARLSTRGWQAIGLHGAGSLLSTGQAASNPIAAMPSLHTAFALLVVAVFFGSVRKRYVPVLLLYPLAMMFTLLYCGEHWVIDMLIGWLYVGLTFLAVGLGESWWARRGSGRPRRRTPGRGSAASAGEGLDSTQEAARGEEVTQRRSVLVAGQPGLASGGVV